MKIVPRGVLKAYILTELNKKPRHGYDIIKIIEEKTGFWKPSPGTVYPLLNRMIKDGYVKPRVERNRKVYSLSRKGKLLAKKIERTRKELRKSLVNTLSSLVGIDKKSLETFVVRWRKYKELKIMIFQIAKKSVAGLKAKKRPIVFKILKETIEKLDKI